MKNTTLQPINGKAAFEKAIAPADTQLRALETERLRLKATLCRELALATTRWADQVAREMQTNPQAYKDKARRAEIAYTLLDKFLACETHSSFDDFSTRVRAQGYNLSTTLIHRYRLHGEAPNRNNLLPFMRAMAAFGMIEAQRLDRESGGVDMSAEVFYPAAE